MLATYVLSALLIIGFDLDDIDSSDLKESQKIVGYIILLLISVYAGSFAISCG